MTSVKASTRINLHSHSNCSDGTLPPERVAELLLAAGVEYAALTDHDTTQGLEPFRRVLSHHGIGVVSGVEITASFEGREIHLLGYGIDPSHRRLQDVLTALSRHNDTSVHGLVGSIRNIGERLRSDGDGRTATVDTSGGRIDIADAIELVHEAGGLTILAHPMIGYDSIDELKPVIGRLKALGLDGIEAVYSSFSEATRRTLIETAAENDLLVTAGTDFHDPESPAVSSTSIEMPTALWKQFRDALQGPSPTSQEAPQHPDAPHGFHGLKWSFLLRFVLPSVTALVLFALAIFTIIIPGLENRLLDRKREMIRELTNSAWSMLAGYEQDARSGIMSRDEAQRLAKSRIATLRYGRDQKDYFWITDTGPRMIMHPYRSDLNGKDVSEFRDARGHRIFAEFADLVKRRREGYVEYYWQWNDDPQRVVPKESFIRLFEPWGWIIGTGIYIEDVEHEISGITRTMANTLVVIAGAIGLLLAFLAQQSLGIERQRAAALTALRDWNERYKSLIEASTEGTAMILSERCSYANPTLLEMLGYSEAEFKLLRTEDLLADESALTRINAGGESAATEPFEATLRNKSGDRVECLMTSNRMKFAGQEGLILIAKDLRRHRAMIEASDPIIREFGRRDDNVPFGILRLEAGHSGTIVEANRSGRRMLSISAEQSIVGRQFTDFLENEAAFAELHRKLDSEGSVPDSILRLRSDDGNIPVVAVSGVVVRDEAGRPVYYDLALQDISDRRKADAANETLVEGLQSSLLFLHAPIAHVMREPMACDMNLSVAKLAALMSRTGSTAVLVEAEAGKAVGIITDHDLRDRVIGQGRDTRLPAFQVMSSPIITVHEDALMYEALMLMEEKKIGHLAVMHESGNITAIVAMKDLMQFPQYGSAVITREIRLAADEEKTAAARQRLPILVGALLDSGAKSRNVTRIITSVSDSVTERLIELAISDLGPPPAGFAFTALGSEGREEQTLATDQDNAIVYEDVDADRQQEVNDYFHRLGTRVCDSLDKAGYRFCTGNIMAKNPKWCKPLSQWKRNFERWIHVAEPQELLEFNTFFDLRAVYGRKELILELRDFVRQAMHQHPPFFLHLAQNALLYKAPATGLIGKIVSATAGDNANMINLKDAMLPVVNFARLYALREGVMETNTNHRLDRLMQRRVLASSTHEEIVFAYDYLMQIRLNHQATAIRNNLQPDNLIDVSKLTHLENSVLSRMFAQITSIRKKISYDFLGGT